MNERSFHWRPLTRCISYWFQFLVWTWTMPVIECSIYDYLGRFTLLSQRSIFTFGGIKSVSIGELITGLEWKDGLFFFRNYVLLFFFFIHRSNHDVHFIYASFYSITLSLSIVFVKSSQIYTKFFHTHIIWVVNVHL